jgi:uncharacterized protein
MTNHALQSAAPWWKFGHVWMVVAGPAVVVVASFITLYLAITRPDPVVSEDYYRKGLEINKTLGENVPENARTASGQKGLISPETAKLAPAMQARNHAATGVAVPVPAVEARQ